MMGGGARTFKPRLRWILGGSSAECAQGPGLSEHRSSVLTAVPESSPDRGYARSVCAPSPYQDETRANLALRTMWLSKRAAGESLYGFFFALPCFLPWCLSFALPGGIGFAGTTGSGPAEIVREMELRGLTEVPAAGAVPTAVPAGADA